MNSAKEMIGAVIETEAHGNVKIIDFEEHPEWGNKTNIYLGKPSLDSCIGGFHAKGAWIGGALIVEQTQDPVSQYNKDGMLIKA